MLLFWILMSSYNNIISHELPLYFIPLVMRHDLLVSDNCILRDFQFLSMVEEIFSNNSWSLSNINHFSKMWGVVKIAKPILIRLIFHRTFFIKKSYARANIPRRPRIHGVWWLSVSRRDSACRHNIIWVPLRLKTGSSTSRVLADWIFTPDLPTN